MKKYIGFMFTLIFPYVIIVGGILGVVFAKVLEKTPITPLHYIYLLLAVMLLAIPFTLITAVVAIKRQWRGKTLAKINLIIKIAQIPFYVIVFAFGLIMTLANPILAIPGVVPLMLFDCVTIFLSGSVGLTAVWRCYKENIFSKPQMIITGICQYVFCIDVIIAVLIYMKSKKS